MMKTRGITVLVALVMAAALVLYAPMAQAKKKHRHHGSPAYNVVQCPNAPTDDFDCSGTAGNDFLIGGPASRKYGAFDDIRGGEGDDVYDGGDGADTLYDTTTSDDYYLLPSTEFSKFGFRDYVVLQDNGGSDVLDLGSYESTDFALSSRSDGTSALYLDGPGARDILIYFFFTSDSIDYFKFSDKILTAQQVKDMF